MNDAGKIAFTPKGDYDSTVTYEYLDTVVYNGNAYAAQKTTTGNVPIDSEDDEYWVLLVRGGTSVPIATEEVKGAVKASGDIGVSEDAKMVLKTDFAEQADISALSGTEDRKTFFGKIAKAISTLISHITMPATGSVLGHVKITTSSSVTDSTGLALSAVEKNASVSGTLANQISTLNTDLTDTESDISALKTKTTTNATNISTLTTNAKETVVAETGTDTHYLRLTYNKATGIHKLHYTRLIECNNGTTVYIVPSGHRPSSLKRFACQALVNNSHDFALIQVNTNGAVTLNSIYTDGTINGEFYIEW